MPNEGSKRPISYFALPVDNVERITGIDFFSDLPDDTEKELESYCDYKDWE